MNGLGDKVRVLGQNPDIHMKNMETPDRKTPGKIINQDVVAMR